MFVGIDVDVINVASTPLNMLVTVLVLAAVAAFFLFLFTYIGAPFVDKRWPADEPLDPVEMLWGESGGYVQRTFPTLDLTDAKDLASQLTESDYGAGDTIVEQGEPATFFYMITEGEVEVSQRVDSGGLVREDVINRLGPGRSFGEAAILRRTARTATVRALTPVKLMKLSAEDFIAGTALSESENNQLLARVDDYMQSDADRARSMAAATNVSFFEAAAAPAATATATSTATASVWQPTHVVPSVGLPAWNEPSPDQPIATTLDGGVELAVAEQRGDWARVVAANGWEGWVDARALELRRG